MGAVSLLFTRRHHPGSVIVRAGTWSAWSHVDLIDGTTLLGAAAFEGVQRTSMAARVSKASRAAIMTIPCESAGTVLAAARSQIGAGYDWLGTFGIALRRDWQEPDRWFCSELVAFAFQMAGHPLFRADALPRITPQHIWMLPHEVRDL